MTFREWLMRRRGLVRAARGMTLLEIMVVIAIIGIMTSAIAVGVAGYMNRAKVQACKAKIRNIGQAVQTYMLDEDCPGDLGVLVSDGMLKKEQLKDEWKEEIRFSCSSQKAGLEFELCSNGPDKKQGTADDICNE